MITEPRLTIAIPLHGARPWIEGVKDTVSKAPAWSRVVISDASRIDDSADLLGEHFSGDPRVTVVSRPETLDWVQHANLVLEEADTEYFCWMPQDDLVFPDRYFDLLVSCLDANPDRVLAFPHVFRRVTRGRFRRREVDPARFRSPPVQLGSGAPESEALTMLRSGNMTIAWRGVFRLSLARPVPETTDAADLIWTFSMALAGSFVEVPDAKYLKRYHRGSAHRTRMKRERTGTVIELYRREVEARLGNDPVLRDQVLGEIGSAIRPFRMRRAAEPLLKVGRFATNWPRVVFEDD